MNYVTPTNYLELVTGYLSLLAERRKKLQDLVAKYVGGVEKIEEAKKEVEEMSKVPCPHTLSRYPRYLSIRVSSYPRYLSFPGYPRYPVYIPGSRYPFWVP